jgi:hypothetical protein
MAAPTCSCFGGSRSLITPIEQVAIAVVIDEIPTEIISRWRDLTETRANDGAARADPHTRATTPHAGRALWALVARL